jgi:hypothetical protein
MSNPRVSGTNVFDRRAYTGSVEMDKAMAHGKGSASFIHSCALQKLCD